MIADTGRVTGRRFPTPLAVPERLTGARAPVPGEPLWIVHGPGVEDHVVGADLRVRPAEELVWATLRAAGFERVVFSAYRNPVYFRDEHSRGLTRSTASAPARPRTMRRFSGPLGKRMVVDAPRPEPARRPAASDPQRVQMISALMEQDSVRTAVVVPNAETLLENLQADMRRAVAEMMGRWHTGQVGAGNVCVLMFTEPDFTRIVDFVGGQRYLPQLRTRFAGWGAAGPVTALGLPDEDELGRLVQVARLKHGMAIADWTALPYLQRLMAAQEYSVRRWEAHLRALGEQPLSVAALRERGLIRVDVPDSGDLWQRLDDLVGLGPVKEFLAAHRHTVEADAVLRELGGADPEPPSLHLALIGNPGTGKTTVAHLIGGLYRDLGLLRRGHVVEASIEQLVSPNVGETARLTAATIRSALDGVLFIDEVYRLSDQADGHGGESINVLLEEMERNRDRLAVVIAAYPRHVDAFLAINPGLPSRFPQGNRIHFPDYTPDELYAIVRKRLAKLPCAPDLEAALRTITATLYRTRDEDFGNGRVMRELANGVQRQWARRTKPTRGGGPIEQATAADVPEEFRRHLVATAPLPEVLAELDQLVGLRAVKDAIREIAAVLELRQEQPHRRSTVVAPHMLFVGSPGTGKTTVAKLMGRVFAALGLLVKGHVVPVTRADLVAGFVGQTAGRTRAKALEALDGVLLVDEAYDLVKEGNDFGGEAITELLTIMEEYRGRLVVVAAGYPGPMEAFLRANDGLRSRFAQRLVFEDYTAPELRLIFERLAETEGYQLAPTASAKAARWLEAERERALAGGYGFGNGRAVRELFGVVERHVAVRVTSLPRAERAAHATTITPADVPDPKAGR
ncbi:AAA family ATPase [Actinokineospora fastidiosa]|uniref:AAA+ ATPase domain-containing protein n=1 Tax=Actinokineospora fastidiosa TaxID=1816 RepID=A0A918GQK2_9PSEU|nr:AAA family ATPase [Actinokineospora fastidiosa]GGS54811.1 hypothetical protein GCM10010171_57450 [Actinokineospora fastidiosa]